MESTDNKSAPSLPGLRYHLSYLGFIYKLTLGLLDGTLILSLMILYLSYNGSKL
jgi:hypothetical protein